VTHFYTIGLTGADFWGAMGADAPTEMVSVGAMRPELASSEACPYWSVAMPMITYVAREHDRTSCTTLILTLFWLAF